MRIFRTVLLAVLSLVTLAALVPLAWFLAALVLSNALGCEAKQSFIDSCAMGGAELVNLINLGFVMGWALILALPVLLICLLIWAVVWSSRSRKGSVRNS